MTKSKKKSRSRSKSLDPQRVGLTLAIMTAFGILFLGLLSKFLGWASPIVRLIESLYIGYTDTCKGIFIGMIWGFLDGFVGGYLFAWIYNKLG